MIEQQLISKILNEENFFIVNKYRVDETDFTVLRPAFEFVRDYASKYGQTPSYEAVVSQYEEFEYEPTVVDTFPYLCGRIKDATAKRQTYDLLQNKVSDKFGELEGRDFTEWIKGEIDEISRVSSTKASVGTNFATNGMERWGWYEERQNCGSDMFVPLPWDTMNTWLGGGSERGDYILLSAYTNRGKSWIAAQMGLKAWQSGFGVLMYSPEMTKYQTMNRLDTLHGHYNHGALRVANLFNEKEYEEYLTEFNAEVTNPYIVKTMVDLQEGLSLDVIEADLMNNPNIGMVIIDGFNLMEHNGRDKARNNMSATSRKLRKIFAQHEVAGVVVHQVPTSAEKENREEDDEGNRTPNPPRIDQYSETIAVIQDASTILNFDQVDGVGMIRLAKSRVGNVDKILELQCNFDYGFIEEAPIKDSIEFLSI